MYLKIPKEKQLLDQRPKHCTDFEISSSVPAHVCDQHNHLWCAMDNMYAWSSQWSLSKALPLSYLQYIIHAH
jgi:hypothetical protein